jgi:hypothetical protein
MADCADEYRGQIPKLKKDIATELKSMLQRL